MSIIVTHKQAIASAVLFGFHGINLFKNLVAWELLRSLENFHFSISKHFDFTFYFLRKNESILISLGTSQKRVKAFFFTFHFSNFKNPLSLVPDPYRMMVVMLAMMTICTMCTAPWSCQTCHCWGRKGCAATFDTTSTFAKTSAQLLQERLKLYENR